MAKAKGKFLNKNQFDVVFLNGQIEVLNRVVASQKAIMAALILKLVGEGKEVPFSELELVHANDYNVLVTKKPAIEPGALGFFLRVVKKKVEKPEQILKGDENGTIQ